MDSYIAKSTAVMTFAITFIVLVEKVATHERTITQFFQDCKSGNIRNRALARQNADIEQKVEDLYRAISRWEHRT